MGGRGPKPSPNPRRRNPQPKEELTGKSAIEAPALFKRAKYSVATQRWYDTWCESEQAEAFWPTDWERLQQLAPLVEQYWRLVDEAPMQAQKILAELRMNEERLGATVRDRQALRMAPKKKDDEPEKPTKDTPAITHLDRYREAYGG